MEGKENPVINEIRKQVNDLQEQGFEAVSISYPTKDGGYDTYLCSNSGFGYEDELMKSYAKISTVILKHGITTCILSMTVRRLKKK